VGASRGEAERKARLGLLQGWASIGVNSGIFLAKLALGLALGSIALVADSADSFFDVVGSAIVVWSIYWFRRPRDREHPFGHGRMDLVAGLIMSVLLVVVGIELGHSSVNRILHPPDYTAPWWMIAVVALSIPIKEGLATFSRKISEATGLSSMEASYWYLRFDAITSTTVTLGLLLSRWGWTVVDGWIGLFLSGVVAWTGILLVISGIGPLVGEAPTEAEVRAIEQAAGRLDGVREVHDVILHKYGDTRLTGCKAIVHVDPVDRDHPAYSAARERIGQLVAEDQRLVGFHDLRVVGPEDRFNLSVDLVTRVQVLESEYPDMVQEYNRRISSEMRGVSGVEISLEAPYSGDGLREPKPG